jgi:hypothetical protein
MRKLFLIVIATMTGSIVAHASFVVWSSDNLLTSAAGKVSATSDGWLVAMYQDTNGDNAGAWYNELSLSPDGEVASTSGVTQDDAYLSTYVAYLSYNPSGSTGEELQYGTSYGGVTDNADVYTVIYNASSVGLASQFVVADSSPFNVESGEITPHFYTVSGIAGDWQAIPEPAVAGLIVIFGGGMLIGRRIFGKS